MSRRPEPSRPHTGSFPKQNWVFPFGLNKGTPKNKDTPRWSSLRTGVTASQWHALHSTGPPGGNQFHQPAAPCPVRSLSLKHSRRMAMAEKCHRGTGGIFGVPIWRRTHINGLPGKAATMTTGIKCSKGNHMFKNMFLGLISQRLAETFINTHLTIANLTVL